MKLKTTAKWIRFCLLLTVVIIATVLSINYQAPKSTNLKRHTETSETEDGRKITITSYTDGKGHVTTASDKGYATVRRTRNRDGKAILEEYLDEDGEPVILSSGFDTIRRTYNEKQLADTDTYYASGIQVTRKEGYAQYCRIYDDQNRMIMIEYRDPEGSLVNNTSGYARRIRTFNEQNKISEERFYSADGQTAALSLGHSGYIRQYDDQGRIIETVYTGPDGTPINTKKGYSKVMTVYNSNGSTKIQYYDADGNPVTGGNSNYGVLSVSGQKIYLDEDGEAVQRLDNILNTRPYLVLIIGTILTVAVVSLKGYSRWIFLFLYIGFVLYITMAYREQQDSRNRLELFYSYRRILSNAALRQQIVNNIWLFIPFGAALSSVISGRFASPAAAIISILICLCFSALIEAVQYIAGIGLCEADDMISNTIGGIIGVTFFVLWKRTGRKSTAV